MSRSGAPGPLTSFSIAEYDRLSAETRTESHVVTILLFSTVLPILEAAYLGLSGIPATSAIIPLFVVVIGWIILDSKGKTSSGKLTQMEESLLKEAIAQRS